MSGYLAVCSADSTHTKCCFKLGSLTRIHNALVARCLQEKFAKSFTNTTTRSWKWHALIENIHQLLVGCFEQRGFGFNSKRKTLCSCRFSQGSLLADNALSAAVVGTRQSVVLGHWPAHRLRSLCYQLWGTSCCPIDCGHTQGPSVNTKVIHSMLHFVGSLYTFVDLLGDSFSRSVHQTQGVIP